MINELENIRYNFEKQKEEYTKITVDFSLEKKQELLKELLETDLWSYFQFITEILFDLVSDEDKYLESLEKVYNKVKNDMASSPFFEMLIKIGMEEKEKGMSIYNRIQKESKNDNFKEISGFILGGYSVNDDTILNKLIEDKKLSYPLTNTLVKAIMVKSERLFDKDNKYNLSKKEYEFLDFVSQSDDERFLRELMNLYRFLYHIDETYFYKKIKDLMSKKKSSINGMIWIFKEKLKLSNTQLLELAELTKDCDEYAIGELMSALTHNKQEYSSQEIKQISELLIYWINKDLDLKVRFFDYSLEELSKKNIEFLDYFLENYKKIKIIGKSLNYNFLFPSIFERLIKHRMKESIPKLLEKDIKEKDIKLFYKLADKIIGIIYKTDEKEWFDLFLPLAKEIQNIAKNEDFINHKDKRLKDYTFDNLIDYIKELLGQFMFRKRDFDFDEIYKNLAKFKKLNEVVKSKLEKLQKDGRYSPMFWVCSWQRDNELKQAYLQEMENFIIKSKTIENKKSGDNMRELMSRLDNENSFWNTFSEIIFANKFLPSYNSLIEPKIPNTDNNADLAIELQDKQILFEVVNPETNRNVHMDNGAVWVKNKLDYVIRKKSAQFFSKKTFDEMKDKTRKDLFLIVVDSSSSMIDEHMVKDSFYGSLAVEFYRNDKTGETTEPRTIRKDDAIIKNKEFISGLVYFKRQLVNLDGEIKLILVGDIIINPHAINKPTKEEVEELKKVIFS